MLRCLVFYDFHWAIRANVKCKTSDLRRRTQNRQSSSSIHIIRNGYYDLGFNVTYNRMFILNELIFSIGIEI